MSSCVVVVNDCAAVAAIGGPVSVRSRTTPHGERNFLLNFGHVAAGLPRQLSDREMDWIETAGHLFAVDLAVLRGPGDLAWSRNIEAYLPVRDPDYWNTIAPRIEDVFGEFTSDRLRLHFVSDPKPDAPPRQRSSPFPPHDCVALVSGGVDSFVGAARLIDEGFRPLGVSHTAAGATVTAQMVVEETLRARLPEFERVGLTARKEGNSFPDPEKSQRSRSFLFLAAALLAAAVGEVDDVYINENGPMAIHIPMTAARVGSLSTHTASPAILERIESLGRDVLGRPLQIRNNLLELTKPEVVELGVRLQLTEDLPSTVSCWSIGRTRKHCGVCAPCLIRRISFEWNSLDDAERAADPFSDWTALEADFARDNLTHFVQFIDGIASRSDLELQLDYPEILSGASQLSPSATIDLHRRWAAQAQDVLFRYPVPGGLR